MQEPDEIEVRKTPLWRFGRHPDRDKILETNRHYNVEYEEWWDYTYDYAQEQWQEKGIEVEQKHMFFSGFCNQGDGACFTDCRIDWAKLWPHLNHADYPLLDRYLHLLPQPRFTRYDHRDCHENTVGISLLMDHGEECDIVWEALLNRFPAINAMSWQERHRAQRELMYTLDRVDDPGNRFYQRLGYELQELESELDDYLRDEMRRLYALLREEYDYLTSDAALTDYFSEQGQLFDEYGNIHH
jgi:hypothetical protein